MTPAAAPAPVGWLHDHYNHQKVINKHRMISYKSMRASDNQRTSIQLRNRMVLPCPHTACRPDVCQTFHPPSPGKIHTTPD